MKAEDRIGQVFSRLTIVGVERGGREALALFRCVCGGTGKAPMSRITGGGVRSCGCLKSEVTKSRNLRHGMSASPEYRVWVGILTRCLNPNSSSYRRYGGAGITVSEAWRSFEVFFSDMGPRPSPKHSVERRNLNLGYEKLNCVWATPVEQARNKRGSLLVEIGGRSISFAQAAEEAEIPYSCAYYRLQAGWDVERIFSTPSRRR